MLARALTPSTDAIARLRTIEDVSRALARGAMACIVRRRLSGPLSGLERHLPEPPFARSVPLGGGFSARNLMHGAFAEPFAGALARDIVRLRAKLRLFAREMDGKAELHTVEGDECRKFHVDYYGLRLLVTYVGPGTEVVRSEAVEWSALGMGGDDVERANRLILRDPGGVVRAQTGDVVVLRGAKDSPRGAVHRSPPVELTGARRLVLKLTLA